MKQNVSRIVAPILLALSALAAQAQVLHADGPRPSFEVATIKPSPADATGLNMSLVPAHFKISHIAIHNLIMFAYNIRSEDQLTGEPPWTKTAFFDIQAQADHAKVEELAKLPQGQSIEVLKLMMQSLLEERLKLRFRSTTESLTVFELEIAKGGSKLTEVPPLPATPPATASSSDPAAARPPVMGPVMLGYTGKNQITAKNINISIFADWLSRQAEVASRPIIDKTGLSGRYGFVLNGVPNQRAPSGPGAEDGSASLFTILPEQLGLRLVPAKRPTEVLVIDTIVQPTEN